MTQVRGKRSARVLALALLVLGCSSGSTKSGTTASSQLEGDATTTSIVIGPDGSSSVVVAPIGKASSTGGDDSPVVGGATPSGIEVAVVAHEVGHLLGLV